MAHSPNAIPKLYDSIAHEYVSGTSYASGVVRFKDGVLYQSNTTTSTTWVASEWTEVKASEVGGSSTSSVTSVNGKTGAVVIDDSDVGAVKKPSTAGTAGMFLALDTDGTTTIWKTAGSATAPVTSVQGMQGDVVIDGSEITIDKTTPGSTTLNAAINSKANSADVYSKTETYTQTEINTALGTKANASDVYSKSETYTKTEVDSALNNKADASDTYTKTQVDTALGTKANASDVYSKSETYTQTEINTALGTKANSSDVTTALSTKRNISDSYSKTETNDLLDSKMNNGDAYLKSETYTKTEIDTALSAKANQSNTYTKSEVTSRLNNKINKPGTSTTAGYVPAANSSGDVTWRQESVVSVNSKTGAVVLQPVDVNAAAEVHTHNLADVGDAGSAASLDADTSITATSSGVPTTATVFTYLGNNYIPIPTTAGTNGQVLSTDGAGGYSWIENGSGSVVGVASINGKNGVVILAGDEITTTTGGTNTIAQDISSINTALSNKYEKPSTGIAKSELESSVQTSLGKADTAYQKASTGIPSTDMNTAVQASLSKADTALQSSDLAAWAKAANKPTYTYTEVGAAAATHTHNLGDITDAGTVASLNKSSSVSQHTSSTVYTSAQVYDNFLKNDASSSANVITAASSTGTGLEIKNSSDNKKIDIASDSVNIVEGTKSTNYKADAIVYDTGTSGGTIELNKVATEISIGGTYFTNTMNSYNLAAGTLGQVMTTGASDTVQWKTLTASDVGAAAASHNHSASEITSGTFDAARIGTVNLDALTATTSCPTIPLSLLPSYVSNVVEVNTYSELPTTGESNKIYLTKDTNKSYRWSGSSYIELNQSVALGETELTAYRGDRGKIAYEHSQTQGSLGGAVSQGVYKVALSSTGHVTGYASVTKADIETICGSLGSIDTISINGTALPISSSKDVALPISSTTTLGLAKPNGESIDAVSGILYVKEATATDMAGRIARTVINAYNYDTAVHQALTDNANSTVAYSAADKLAVRTLINAVDRQDVAPVYDSSQTYAEGALVYNGNVLSKITSGVPVATTIAAAMSSSGGSKIKWSEVSTNAKYPVIAALNGITSGSTTEGYGLFTTYINPSTGLFNTTKLSLDESEIVMSKTTTNGIKFSY